MLRLLDDAEDDASADADAERNSVSSLTVYVVKLAIISSNGRVRGHDCSRRLKQLNRTTRHRRSS